MLPGGAGPCFPEEEGCGHQDAEDLAALGVQSPLPAPQLRLEADGGRLAEDLGPEWVG